MIKKLIYTCTLFSCLLLLAGCADDLLSSIYRGDGVQLTITLNVPGESSAATRAIKTRAGGDNQYDNQLDDYTDLQRYIAEGDIYILVYEISGSDTILMAVPTITSISGDNGAEQRTITAEMSRVTSQTTILIDVVANIAENGVTVPSFSSMIGSYTREEVYSALGTFAHPENSESNPFGVWTLQTTDGNGNVTAHRYLPMWGQSSDTNGSLATYTIDSDTRELDATCNLYRSVAKLGVLVDSECSTFELTEIYVYYPNSEGTFVSVPVASGEYANWSQSVNTQYTLPAVPSTATARSIDYPLVYRMSTPVAAGGSYTNSIYVTEADNINNGTNPVCLVVGGYYTGGSYGGEGLDDNQINYYRIDLESTSSTTGSTGAFDIIRNHSYLFNILNANNPGTSDPDPRSAAAGLQVEVLDYTDVPMHGINSQYTLNVSQSLFAFEGATTYVGELEISSDGEGWELVTQWSEADGYPSDGETGDWLTLTDINAGNHTDNGDIVTIEPSANINTADLRNTSFYIKCGQILKRIDVVQDVTETGNTYQVAAGTYDLMVDVRGNGNTSAWNDETGNDTIAIDFGQGAMIEDFAYAAVIWETADGFVTIPNPTAKSTSGCISYTVNNVSLTPFGDWTGNVFDPGNGANALIGVYNSNDSLVWSYHIWGLGDYANGVLTEEWVVGRTGQSTYNFMDRNLGAYSNLPGSASFGLLYQWGRKDPFIGAYRENNERDYRQVRKQYTRHYQQPNGKTYVWSNYDDSQFADSYEGEAALDQFTVRNPTTILEYGLLSDIHEGDQAHGLWGTTSYEYDNSETGNKTMYDPCPPGFRVPSLNALTIYDGTYDMWTGTTAGNVQHSAYTARYVPIGEGDSYRSTAQYTASFHSDAPFYGFWFDYSGAAGFANTYASTTTDGYGVTYYSETSLANGTCGWMENYSNSNPGKPANVTWLPLAGIYNGTMNHFGRAGLTDRMGNSNEPYLPASSLQVSSVLWANSPTNNTTGGGNYPAGLLLHGTEGAYAPTQTDGTTTYQYSPGTADGNGGGSGTNNTVATDGPGYWTTATTGYSNTASGWWTGSVDAKKSSMDPTIEEGQWNYTTGNEVIGNYNNWTDRNGLAGSGRHFHSYADPTISTLANPSYAASVRCIRDKDAIVHTNDSIFIVDAAGNRTAYEGEELTLYYYGTGGSVQDEISLAISYIEEWEVVSPGAKWVSINPTSGTTSNSSGTIDAIEITYIDAYLPEDASTTNPATATITIKTARGTTFSINIQYVGGTRGQ